MDTDMERIRSSVPNGGNQATVSPLKVLTTILWYRWLIAKVALGTAVLSLGLWIVLAPPREFEATSVFQPQNADASAQPSNGVARQLLGLLGAGQGTPMDFYAQVLTSRELLERTASSHYRIVAPDSTLILDGSLVELYGGDANGQQARLKATVDQLARDVTVSIDSRSGLMRLMTRASWSTLAVQLNQRLLQALGDFEIDRRQGQVRAERKFLQGRMTEVRQELDKRETKLEAFLQSNRSYRESPPLLFEEQRLDEEVQLYRDLYRSLAESHEQARIAEVRNTPVITIIDPPENSVQTTGGAAAVSVVGVVALFLGGLLGLFAAFVAEYFRRSRRETPVAFEEFASARRSLAREISPRRLMETVRRRTAR